MIKSMTGFGRCEVQREARKFTVELKGVNHRYLDINIRMPKKLNFFETAIRTLLKSYVTRGKVDIFITYEDSTQNQMAVKYNSSIAAEYLKYLRQMAEEFGLEDDIRVSTLSRYPEVFTMEEQTEDEEELWNGLKEALEGAFSHFVETRTAEGENLKKDILDKLSNLEVLIGYIEERSPQIIQESGFRMPLSICLRQVTYRLVIEHILQSHCSGGLQKVQVDMKSGELNQKMASMQ